jgi:hypothetical protein
MGEPRSKESPAYETENDRSCAGARNGCVRGGLPDAAAANAVVGGALGAGTGALVGSAVSGGSAGGALAGAAIGAGTGALIGSAATPQPAYYGAPPPPRRCAQWAYDYNGNRVCTAFY